MKKECRANVCVHNNLLITAKFHQLRRPPHYVRKEARFESRQRNLLTSKECFSHCVLQGNGIVLA